MSFAVVFQQYFLRAVSKSPNLWELPINITTDRCQVTENFLSRSHLRLLPNYAVLIFLLNTWLCKDNGNYITIIPESRLFSSGLWSAWSFASLWQEIKFFSMKWYCITPYFCKHFFHEMILYNTLFSQAWIHEFHVNLVPRPKCSRDQALSIEYPLWKFATLRFSRISKYWKFANI